MIKNLIIEKQIEIIAKPEDVWDALINPDKIKLYLFGTHAVSEWMPVISIMN